LSSTLSFEMAKQIVESSFSPIKCYCELVEGGMINIRLRNVEGSIKIDIQKIEASRLSTVRGVAQLTLEIRQALANYDLKRRRNSLEK
jgi:hypothetical protein